MVRVTISSPRRRSSAEKKERKLMPFALISNAVTSRGTAGGDSCSVAAQ
jgi:hypothetical protein